MRVLAIPEEGPIRIYNVPEDTEEQLETLQRMVDGYIQTLDADGGIATLICNEEGKMHNLPVNERGTVVFHTFCSGHIPGDFIAGQLLITGWPDAEGELTSVRDDVVEAIADGFHLDPKDFGP